jgi:hypothetical protein
VKAREGAREVVVFKVSSVEGELRQRRGHHSRESIIHEHDLVEPTALANGGGYGPCEVLALHVQVLEVCSAKLCREPALKTHPVIEVVTAAEEEQGVQAAHREK